MNWFSEYENEWKAIIETVAAEKHRTTQMVEKDTIQSIFLFRLSESEIPFVFKGGTSLSKAYGLIDRFSEDIDLSLDHRPSEAERKKINGIIIETANDLGLDLADSDDVKSRHSYNKYVFEYNSLFSDMPLEIIVETSFYQAVYPVYTHTVNSIIGSFCKDRNITLPIPFKGSEFSMHVQSLERTFIDKIFAICDYRIQNMQDRDSRHLYDIAKILPFIFLDQEFKDLIGKVRRDRMQSRNNPSAQPEYDITAMLKDIIRSRFYESDYNTLTKRLLYENISYDEAIANGIAKVAELSIF